MIRGVGWVRGGEDGLRDIGNIPLKDVDGMPVRVRDVARAVWSGDPSGCGTMTRRDEGNPEPLGEVVAGIVLKRMGANTKATIDGVRERLPPSRRPCRRGKLEPFYDQADLVRRRLTR